MKKGKIILVCLGILSVMVFILFVFIKKNVSNEVEENALYTLITDREFETMLDDGGSHEEQYYTIDFDNNKVIKYEAYYSASNNWKYIYKDKELYTKYLNSNNNTRLQELIDIIIEFKGKKMNLEESDYLYYRLKLPSGEIIEYNNYDVINEIEGILSN